MDQKLWRIPKDKMMMRWGWRKKTQSKMWIAEHHAQRKKCLRAGQDQGNSKENHLEEQCLMSFQTEQWMWAWLRETRQSPMHARNWSTHTHTHKTSLCRAHSRLPTLALPHSHSHPRPFPSKLHKQIIKNLKQQTSQPQQ